MRRLSGQRLPRRTTLRDRARRAQRSSWSCPARAEAQVLLDRIGLGDKAHEFPDRLSGGQQQRAAMVRAIATNPRVLLLDEVTSALDPELVGEVLDLIRELKQTGVTIVMATHEMDFAKDVADRVAFLQMRNLLMIAARNNWPDAMALQIFPSNR
jgi:polar amino acid transport system ATP-binding protein